MGIRLQLEERLMRRKIHRWRAASTTWLPGFALSFSALSALRDMQRSAMNTISS